MEDIPSTESNSRNTTASTLIIGISILIGIPIYGIVLRYRVNHTPRVVALADDVPEDDPHANQNATVAQPAHSLLEVIKRVWHIEGVAGFYKGTVPIVISGILGSWGTLLGEVFGYWFLDRGRWMTSWLGVLYVTLWSPFYLAIAILQDIIVNRAIITPYKLGWLNPGITLRTLLTPYERAQPFRLFLTPALAISEILAFEPLILITTLRSRLRSWDLRHPIDTLTLPLGLYLVFLLFSVVILAPLDVLKARASVQRNHPINEEGVTVPAGPEEVQGLAQYADGDVIGFRDEGLPYKSTRDALVKLVMEEGWYALYRAYYVTLGMTLFVGLAGVFK